MSSHAEPEGHTDKYVPLDRTQLNWFHSAAERVLKRRTPGYFWHEASRGLDLLITGIVSIVGMQKFDWSAPEWVLFFIAKLVIGFVCDLIKLKFIQSDIEKYAEANLEGSNVNEICDTIRSGKTKVRSGALHGYGGGATQGLIFADMVFGGFSILVIIAILAAAGESIDLTKPYYLLSILSLSAVPIIDSAIKVYEHTNEKRENPKFSIYMGARGFVLAALMVVMALSFEGPNGLQSAAYAMSVATSLIGLIIILGMISEYQTTRWLRWHMASRTDKATKK